MFEKEAKIWVKEHTEIEYKASYGEFPQEPSAIKSFKAGAEYGYNKAKKDADKMKSRFLELCNLQDMRIAELEKANGWHYVKDGEYPIDEKDVEVLYQDCDKTNVYNCIYDIHAKNWLYYNLDNMVLEPFSYHVIAWKEIVLPKEIE